MQGRAFGRSTTISDDRLALALAPALTRDGLQEDPSFFHGFATRPDVVARGLVALADVTATRYFNYVPSDQRDPVLTAHGDRLRAECFSACNAVYARLDILGAGLDGGEIGFGTTNVDITTGTRRALAAVSRNELMHLDVGVDGLRVATLARQSAERPVQMPQRWVRALGNAAELHRGLRPVFTLGKAASRAFLASLPNATTRGRYDGWLTPTRTGAKLERRPMRGTVRVAGLHRLAAARRMMTHVVGLTAYTAESDTPDEPGISLFELDLPGARLSLGLTGVTWRAFSGEGSLLGSLAGEQATADATALGDRLGFEPVLDPGALSRRWQLPVDRVESALLVLAASGRVGWDPHESAWFHRQLPHDQQQVERDNPRLLAARELARNGSVETSPDGVFRVHSGSATYRVRLDAERGDRCSCRWFVRYDGGRGPCKHVLAARLTKERN